MECDWEVEIGPDAPVIEAFWPGFIDLRKSPSRIDEISEAGKFPALANALIKLNTSPSPVWTAKCDLWETEERDPFEMEASVAEAAAGIACYIDVLPSIEQVFSQLTEAEFWAREQTTHLRAEPLRCCRADLVIRKAFAGDREGLGVSVYLSSCGVDLHAGETALSTALTIVAARLGGTAEP